MERLFVTRCRILAILRGSQGVARVLVIRLGLELLVASRFLHKGNELNLEMRAVTAQTFGGVLDGHVFHLNFKCLESGSRVIKLLRGFFRLLALLDLILGLELSLLSVQLVLDLLQVLEDSLYLIHHVSTGAIELRALLWVNCAALLQLVEQSAVLILNRHQVHQLVVRV